MLPTDREHGRARAGAVLDESPRRGSRLVTLLVAAFVLVAGAWLYLATVDVVVSARGEIVPSGKVRRIQAAEAGVVGAIHVADGQRVSRGQVLVELDPTETSAEEHRLEGRRLRLALTLQRLGAELGEAVVPGEGIEAPAVLVEAERRRLAANRLALSETAEQLERQVDRAAAEVAVALREDERLQLRIAQQRQRLADIREQVDKGIVAEREAVDAVYELDALLKEREVQVERVREARISEQEAKKGRDAERSKHRGRLLDDLAAASGELEHVEQELVRVREVKDRLKVRSPVDGTVQQLLLTTVGAVVERTDPLMVIVPGETGVEFNARILNKDVGFVSERHPARIKVDAFEFTRYGTIDGIVQWIGDDAVAHDVEGLVYPARITLKGAELPNRVKGRQARLSPGMQASADIVTGERRLIEYFLEPLLRYRDESLRER